MGEELIFHSKEEAEDLKSEGRNEGRVEGLKEAAMEMLKKGFSDEVIEEVTHCDEKQISEMRLQLK